MAENSFYNLSHKPSVSTNNKADLITLKLQQHAIALQILSKYPDAMNEYKNAVKNGTAIPSAPVEEPSLVIS